MISLMQTSNDITHAYNPFTFENDKKKRHRDFFNRGQVKKKEIATILSIEGRHYNVDVHYLKR